MREYYHMFPFNVVPFSVYPIERKIGVRFLRENFFGRDKTHFSYFNVSRVSLMAFNYGDTLLPAKKKN